MSDTFASMIVEDIMSDLRSRKGLLDDVEPAIQDEIAADLERRVQQRLDRAVGGVEGVRYLNIGEFARVGFLQEANRLFFHPHGLALEITCDSEAADGYGDALITGIWDYRDDPEGIIFGEVDRGKVGRVRLQRNQHYTTRAGLFASGTPSQPGADIQPPDWEYSG